MKENPSGCARAERFKDRAPLDMFSWLASQHRSVPHPRDVKLAGGGGKCLKRIKLRNMRIVSTTCFLPGKLSASSGLSSGGVGGGGVGSSADLEVSLSSNRRATSLDLPMAMRFRHLAKNAKEAVGVYR